MSEAHRVPVESLRGHREECARLDAALDAVQGGVSRALVVRGEPGVGKTALLDHLGGREGEFRVCRMTGVQCENELSGFPSRRTPAPVPKPRWNRQRLWRRPYACCWRDSPPPSGRPTCCGRRSPTRTARSRPCSGSVAPTPAGSSAAPADAWSPNDAAAWTRRSTATQQRKARAALGWEPRDVVETVVATAEGQIRLGLALPGGD